MELVEGIEPTTARLQGEGSTIELHQHLEESRPARASPLLFDANGRISRLFVGMKIFKNSYSIFLNKSLTYHLLHL